MRSLLRDYGHREKEKERERRNDTSRYSRFSAALGEEKKRYQVISRRNVTRRRADLALRKGGKFAPR